AMAATYNPMELMICCAARLLENGRTVAVGTGVPCAAAMLAQRTAAPDLVIFFEAGGVAPQLPTMPISVGDSRTFHRALMATSMADVMETCQRGMMDYTFLGGAQVDAYGNLNSTMIGGDYARPKVRLPGSGGANDLASLCWRILVVTNHDPRRFVEKVDFVTTPGYLTGPGAREAAGEPLWARRSRKCHEQRSRPSTIRQAYDFPDSFAVLVFDFCHQVRFLVVLSPPREQRPSICERG